MASSLLDPAVDGTPVLDVELPDFTTEAYKSAYSRINAIVIEGEQEAHDNYISLGTLIPDQAGAGPVGPHGDEAHEGLPGLRQESQR